MKQIQILQSEQQLRNYYSVGRTLAACNTTSSSRPVLRHAIENATGESAILKGIVKVFNKEEAQWRSVCTNLLNTPMHPNLMNITGVLETSQSYFIASEKMRGQELFDFLKYEDAIPEDTCKHLTYQILSATDFLHSRQIIHRDIKPENILFRHKMEPTVHHSAGLESCAYRKQLELALIDFDTCAFFGPQGCERTRHMVGTYGYIAPEVLKGGNYTTASDLWSIGVILYIIMTGLPPLRMGAVNGASDAIAAMDQIEKNGINFDMKPLTEFPLAQDLCRKLLTFDPASRLSSARAALNHPWLSSLDKYSQHNKYVQELKQVKQSLVLYPIETYDKTQIGRALSDGTLYNNNNNRTQLISSGIHPSLSGPGRS